MAYPPRRVGPILLGGRNDEPTSQHVQEEEAADVPVIIDEDDDDKSVREDGPGIEAVDS